MIKADVRDQRQCRCRLLVHLIAVYDLQLSPFGYVLKGEGAVIVVPQEIISLTVGVGMVVHRQIL